jgi:hypothetical protein
MSDSPETSGPGQPSDQPFFNQQPAQPPGAMPAWNQPAPGAPAWDQPGPGTGLEPAMAGEPVLVSIGDISVTQSRVFTPSGSRSLNEVSWTVTDMSVTSQGIPTWAIVCAIVFFVFCLLGLLFLLVKESKTQGTVQITVHGPGFVHTSQIPVYSQDQVADINARVNYVRTLTASYSAPSQPGIQPPAQAPFIPQPGVQWPQQGPGPTDTPGAQWPQQGQGF